MPFPSRLTAAALACLAWRAWHGLAAAQAPPAAPATTPATTPAQAEAAADFRPHTERACRALYGRPDDARTCVRSVLDAALPLSLEDAERPTPTIAPLPGARRPRVTRIRGAIRVPVSPVQAC